MVWRWEMRAAGVRKVEVSLARNCRRTAAGPGEREKTHTKVVGRGLLNLDGHHQSFQFNTTEPGRVFLFNLLICNDPPPPPNSCSAGLISPVFPPPPPPLHLLLPSLVIPPCPPHPTPPPPSHSSSMSSNSASRAPRGRRSVPRKD